ncbi:hypothetical protein P3T73_01145 [Kiritimatiellota bacterium B12222]|nr:hypothetical protein P3T73_01145 [Kiritimatiellota bacterium B12222]
MNKILFLFAVILISIFFIGGCWSPNDKDKFNGENIVQASGEIRQVNASEDEIWVEELVLGDQDHRAGVLMPGVFKHMGFATFSVGEEIKLEWIEFSKGKEIPANTTYFDTSELVKSAKNIRYLKFTYLGDDKWVLHTYDRSSLDEEFSDEGYLKELVSQDHPLQSE